MSGAYQNKYRSDYNQVGSGVSGYPEFPSKEGSCCYKFVKFLVVATFISASIYFIVQNIHYQKKVEAMFTVMNDNKARLNKMQGVHQEMIVQEEETGFLTGLLQKVFPFFRKAKEAMQRKKFEDDLLAEAEKEEAAAETVAAAKAKEGQTLQIHPSTGTENASPIEDPSKTIEMLKKQLMLANKKKSELDRESEEVEFNPRRKKRKGNRLLPGLLGGP